MVAIGDALGMPSHDMTIDQIKKSFDGALNDFRPAPEDSRVHKGYKAGQITDDTLLTLSLADSYIKGRGTISSRMVAEMTSAVVNEYSNRGLDKMFGPSTKNSVEGFLKGNDPETMFMRDNHPTMGASNGGAMKISPVGLVHPGHLESVLGDTFKVCLLFPWNANRDFRSLGYCRRRFGGHDAGRRCFFRGSFSRAWCGSGGRPWADGRPGLSPCLRFPDASSWRYPLRSRPMILKRPIVTFQR